MKISIIGAGKIGGTLGRLWAASGHDVVFGVRHPDRITDLVNAIDGPIRAALPDEAVADADVLVSAAPYGAWPAFATAHATVLGGLFVVDAANPYPDRDGDIAREATQSGHGSGTYTAALLPTSFVVKAFNTLYWEDLRDQAHRTPPRIAIPIAGDEDAALALTSTLANDAGFDAVTVGGLHESALLDPGSVVYAKTLTLSDLRTAIESATKGTLT